MPVTIDPGLKAAIEEMTLQMLKEALAAQPPNEQTQYRARGPVMHHDGPPRQRFAATKRKPKPKRQVQSLPQPHSEEFATLTKHVAFGRRIDYKAARELVLTGKLTGAEREFGHDLGRLEKLTTVQKYQAEQIAPLAFDAGVSRVAEAQRIVQEARRAGRKADYVKTLKSLGGARDYPSTPLGPIQ